ncbi:MAG: hypothetical protein ACI97A_004300 [Planctomycetota bacterium]|jgi:hypothetical protein
MKSNQAIRCALATLVISSMLSCATGRGTGALSGGAIGGVIGGAAGGWQWAAVGVAAGAAGGYVIGNEVDETEKRRANETPRPTDFAPLAGTTWRLVTAKGKLAPEARIGSEFQFGADGRIVAYDPGSPKPRNVAEHYRVSGRILIVYAEDYVYNLFWELDGNVLNVKGKGVDERLLKLSLVRV